MARELVCIVLSFPVGELPGGSPRDGWGGGMREEDEVHCSWLWEAAWAHGQVGVYAEACGEVDHRGRRQPDGGRVYPYPFGDDALRAE